MTLPDEAFGDDPEGEEERWRNRNMSEASDKAREALEWIANEAGQYADGAPDAHYLARLLTEVESRARAALASVQEPAGWRDLREANDARQKEWDPGDQITLAYRGNELAGEVGEACNVLKKLERERLGIRGSRSTTEQLAEELADVVICVDLIAMQAGIDLGAAITGKFNATSEKYGLATRLAAAPSLAPSHVGDVDFASAADTPAQEPEPCRTCGGTQWIEPSGTAALWGLDTEGHPCPDCTGRTGGQ